ncbi:MAG: hypothetical protein IJ680_04580 [Paludibacteraceae bacterium]|nr:hypothetical protein [Paludibacteraceae bacterium]
MNYENKLIVCSQSNPSSDMKALIILFVLLMSVMSASAQSELMLPLGADSLTEELRSADAVYWGYPTRLSGQVPELQCGQTTAGIGVFTINESGGQVTFSPGNLQYQASTGMWRFAEHQYDYVGDSVKGNVYENGVKCDNALISSSYSGWIDLFGWGTSGWSSGANAYMPYSTSTNYYDYYPGGNYLNNLTGVYARADWGVYNQIGADAAGTWRTLTESEWRYVLRSRANASQLQGQGTVNGVAGFILLPDGWVAPAGISFTAGTDIGYTINTYSLTQWALLEQTGAVFLVASGLRYEMFVNEVQSYTGYWSATSYGSNESAWNFDFASWGAFLIYAYRENGLSVRLVQDL